MQCFLTKKCIQVWEIEENVYFNNMESKFSSILGFDMLHFFGEIKIFLKHLLLRVLN